MTSGTDTVDLLTRLAGIDSVNPSLVPGAAGEADFAEYVADWGRAAGLAVEVMGTAEDRPNVVVRGGRRGSGRALLLCGHLDTVGVADMTDPLSPRIDDDRLYARGAYDMKAGLAAALIACRNAVAAGINGEVLVAAVADEEHASTGIQRVLPHLTADAAIVTEPTELSIATAHKGFVWTEIQVYGKAAHGSRPHLGVDAIIKTGPVLVALDELNRQLRSGQHPTLGPGTVHASLIKGGMEESTIPDRCSLTIERRTLPGETTEDIEREVAALLAKCRTADCDLITTSRTTLAREPFETNDASLLMRTLTDATRSVLGRPAPVGAVSYWADSAFLSAAGIPTVLFGPDGDGAHAEVEWVSLPGTIACAETLTAAALSFCR